MIRGKVSLIVDEEAVIQSALQTPKAPSIVVDTQAYDEKEKQLQVLDQEKPVEKPKQISKTLELIKKITTQPREDDEEMKLKRKQEQEERLKSIKEMIDKEK